MIKDFLTKSFKKVQDNKAVKIGLVIGFITLMIVVMIVFDIDQAQAYIRAHRGQATLISLGLYFLMSLTFLPTSPLTLFLAVFMGPLEAVLLSTGGHSLAAFIEYKIGATMGDIIDFESKKDKLPLGLGDLPMTSPYLLMAGRLLPIGYVGFSIVCGAYQVPFGKYLWTSVVMYFINASVVAFGGAWLARFF